MRIKLPHSDPGPRLVPQSGVLLWQEWAATGRWRPDAETHSAWLSSVGNPPANCGFRPMVAILHLQLLPVCPFLKGLCAKSRSKDMQRKKLIMLGAASALLFAAG